VEDGETPRMHKYGESKMTRIMVATIRHVAFSSGLRKFQASWFLLNRGYNWNLLGGADRWKYCNRWKEITTGI